MNLISYVVKFYFHVAWGGIIMNSCCMDAADNKSVQPIKVLLVAALPVLLVIDMAYPKGARPHCEALSASLPS